jgi:hypothetical protein
LARGARSRNVAFAIVFTLGLPQPPVVAIKIKLTLNVRGVAGLGG